MLKNQLQNCPITVNDANRAIKIYGPDIAALCRKTTQTSPAHVPSYQLRPLPLNILDAHKNVTLCFNILPLVQSLATFISSRLSTFRAATSSNISSHAYSTLTTYTKPEASR